MLTKKDRLKRERFKRVAEVRTANILNMMRLLGNCANTSNYKYSKKDVKKIFSSLETNLNDVKTLFLQQDNNNKKFNL